MTKCLCQSILCGQLSCGQLKNNFIYLFIHLFIYLFFYLFNNQNSPGTHLESTIITQQSTRKQAVCWAYSFHCVIFYGFIYTSGRFFVFTYLVVQKSRRKRAYHIRRMSYLLFINFRHLFMCAALTNSLAEMCMSLNRQVNTT